MTKRLGLLMVMQVAVAAVWVLAPIGVRATTSPVTGPCPTFHDADATVSSLRACSPAQLDALYASLPAGPMPGWDVDSHAYARILAGPLEKPFDFAWQQLWQGQDFYTNQRGGYLMNRVMGDHESVRAPVLYGPSYVDGKTSVLVTYYTDIFASIRVELRRVQPGVYFGSAMHSTLKFREAYVIEDFANPVVSAADCPVCPVLRKR